MHTPAILSLLIVAAAALSAVAASSRCDTEQREQYDALADIPYIGCAFVLTEFETCTDQCAAKFQTVATSAPNCSIPVTGDESVQTRAATKVKLCGSARADMTGKYTPLLTPGVAKCTTAQQNEWSAKHEYGKFDGCLTAMRISKKSCTDECVKAIEDGVTDAPLCLVSGNYTMREYKKFALAKCLKVRGDDLKSNAVLQSDSAKAVASGAKSSSSSDSSPSPASSAAAAPASPVGALPTAILLGSAVLTLLSLV